MYRPDWLPKQAYDLPLPWGLLGNQNRDRAYQSVPNESTVRQALDVVDRCFSAIAELPAVDEEMLPGWAAGALAVAGIINDRTIEQLRREDFAKALERCAGARPSAELIGLYERYVVRGELVIVSRDALRWLDAVGKELTDQAVRERLAQLVRRHALRVEWPLADSLLWTVAHLMDDGSYPLLDEIILNPEAHPRLVEGARDARHYTEGLLKDRAATP